MDISRLQRGDATLADLATGLTAADLRRLTDEMINAQLALIAECDDAAVVFVPADPAAHDPYADDPADVGLAWTLGHLIVHVTASSEEAAFLAAEMARGVLREGRSRYETPWPSVTTIAQCRARLEESRRMRLASLAMWPDAPHLDVVIAHPRAGTHNAVGRFLRGLLHDVVHLEQIAAVVDQARQYTGRA